MADTAIPERPTTAKPTPGEWKVLHSGFGEIYIVAKQSYEHREQVAQLSCYGHEDANAILIAAAPDLLAASKEAADLLLELQHDLPELKYTINGALGPLHAAIRAAEGK